MKPVLVGVVGSELGVSDSFPATRPPVHSTEHETRHACSTRTASSKGTCRRNFADACVLSSFRAPGEPLGGAEPGQGRQSYCHSQALRHLNFHIWGKKSSQIKNKKGKQAQSTAQRSHFQGA